MGYPFSHVIKWCGTIPARFSQVAQRHSHDLCRFSLLDVSSWWRRQLHVVRANKYVRPPLLLLVEWQNLPGDSCCSFHIVQLRTVVFFQKRMISILLYLANMSPALKSRLTAFPLLSFVANGILGHAGGWHLRRKPCVFPLLFLLDFSAPVDFCKVIQAALDQILVKRR